MCKRFWEKLLKGKTNWKKLKVFHAERLVFAQRERHMHLLVTLAFAVMLFMALLIAIGFASYSKELMKFVEKMLKDKKILAKSWFYILIWIALCIWALIEIFV